MSLNRLRATSCNITSYIKRFLPRVFILKDLIVSISGNVEVFCRSPPVQAGSDGPTSPPPSPPTPTRPEREADKRERGGPPLISFSLRFSATVISLCHHLHGSSSEPKPNSLPSSLPLHLPAFIIPWPPSPLREAVAVAVCFSLLGCTGVNTLQGDSPCSSCW